MTLSGRTYLDHGGTTVRPIPALSFPTLCRFEITALTLHVQQLYAKSLIERFSADMLNNLYGNPHSDSAPSALSSQKITTVREKALHFFNADPTHFDLIFVQNATAAIKLVAESFKDLTAAGVSGQAARSRGFWYGYHRDSHTSVVGVREATDGSHRCFDNDKEVEQWLDDISDASTGIGTVGQELGLFAFPGQSNMTGRRLPLSW